MNIHAKITGIEYKPKLVSDLKIYELRDIKDIDINLLPASCIINYKGFVFGLSKWVSPKRTRSYPYERVYNTLGTSKRITIIPIIKDEGQDGDRDFIQWDTISLMSLLDVFVIPAYYHAAEKSKKSKNKITNQKYDNDWIKQKIVEISNYHSSALHWNLKEIENSLPILIEKAKQTYRHLNKELGIKFHGEEGIVRFEQQFKAGVMEFKNTSRSKAQEAQVRETKTIQPKEILSDNTTKSSITIENYLGGKYYFTCDEIKIEQNNLYLIESKHSKTTFLPSIGDIKDGLLKMILYCNLKEVKIENKYYQPIPMLQLTSPYLENNLTLETINDTLHKKQHKNIISKLFEEASENQFKVITKKFSND
ncbi:MAG: hypothetical protein KatS3mg035_1866 [Bacteroidia bacterium]|nr:MAG: hypothetical protein KatS3mg035_1866 [Bacteroidia bacterium]